MGTVQKPDGEIKLNLKIGKPLWQLKNWQDTRRPPTDPPRPPRETLPTMYDLLSEDPEEPGLPDEFHYYQPQLLRETFQPPTYPREQVFIASDLYLYYSLHNLTWYKRPDWFAVLGVSRLYEGHELRLSYISGAGPDERKIFIVCCIGSFT